MTSIRCVVGSVVPRSSSPPKNREREGSGRMPASRRDSGVSGLSSPLLRDSSKSHIHSAQRLDVPRAASLCEAPVRRDLHWAFPAVSDEEDDMLFPPRGFELEVAEDGEATFRIEEWLASEIGQPLSWQRSMLETHWLLESPKQESSRIADQDAEENAEEVVTVRQVRGTTRRDRNRRKQEVLQQEKLVQEEQARLEAEEVKQRVVVKSSARARARRLAARRHSQSSATEAQTTGNLSTLNLQAVCSDRGAVPSRVLPSAEAETTTLARASTWQDKGADDPNSTHVFSFMRDIGFAKLLTKEEEVELANTFRAGENLKQMKFRMEAKIGREVSHAEWAYQLGMTINSLRQTIKAGDRARERLIAANMRLVISVVKKYTRQGVLVSDLITAGTMGLAKGVDRFDPSRGFKLSTYVHWWIRQAVTRAAAEHLGAIRLPMHVHEALAKLKKVKADLVADGQSPTTANIANTLGVSEKRISKMQKVNLSAKSLDEAVPSPAGFTDGSSFHNFMFDPEEEIRTWNQIEVTLLKKDISDILLQKLDARERDIICLHYGLSNHDGVGMTLDNISLKYGVSRERIRQVETVAIRKLKVLCEGKDLQRYCY